MEILAIVVLSFVILLLLILCMSQRHINKKIVEENIELKGQVLKTTNDKKSLIAIEPGDRAIIPNYSLVQSKGEADQHTFTVTYEVDIVDVTTDKVKVRATNFTTNDSKINTNNSSHAGIINFMKDKWISKDQVELVVDDTMRRDVKIQDILQ